MAKKGKRGEKKDKSGETTDIQNLLDGGSETAEVPHEEIARAVGRNPESVRDMKSDDVLKGGDETTEANPAEIAEAIRKGAEDFIKVRQRDFDALKRERGSLNEKFKRALADLENYKKRTEKEKAEWSEFTKREIIAALLTPLEHMDLALGSAARLGEKDKTGEAGKILDGLKLVEAEFFKCFEQWDLAVIEAVGKQFDPAFHQAVMVKEIEEGADGVVLEEYRKGYKLKDFVLRPSQVVVARLKKQGKE